MVSEYAFVDLCGCYITANESLSLNEKSLSLNE